MEPLHSSQREYSIRATSSFFPAFALCCVWLMSQICFAAPKREYQLPPELAWTKVEWTGNDKPFVDIRHNIDQMIAKGSKPDDVLEKYKASAANSANDAQSVFRWAYAADRAALKQHNNEEVEKRLRGVAEALAKPASPESYQYDRLRYLMEVRGTKWGGNGFIVELGKRLVKRNPKDWDVKYFVAYQLLNVEDGLDGVLLAVRYAHEIQRAFPNRPSSYSMLGWMYRCLALGTHNPHHSDIAIANYRKYLQLAPKNYEFREKVSGIIKSIEKDKAHCLAAQKKT